jgi:hypothetical protein
MKDETKIEFTEKPEKFTEGEDYLFEDGLMILTAGFLLKRGYCCQNGCRNCPYPKEGNKSL